MSNITPTDEITPEIAELDELLAPAGDPALDADDDAEDFDDDSEDDSDDAEESDEEFEAEADDERLDADGEPAVPFDSLGLPEALTALLAREGVVDAFPIQAATIPDALAGRHVLGKARTGSGKTLAFGLPMLANLQGKRARKGKPLGLVLVPTRELAMQVSEALRPYGYAIGVDIAAVYGGAPMFKQVYALRRGVEVLVATPGRLTDLIEQEECSLDEVSIAVLDEADQMADMGFMPVVSELLGKTDPSGQRLLFSATLDGAVDELVQKYLTDPVLHSVASEETTPARMDHHLLVVEPTDKSTITAEIAARHTPGSEDSRRTILFARTKLGADRIAEKIREAGVSALALHGGMTQRARTRTLDDFKAGRVPVLVATDVAARGIHVDGIDLVLHVDPANDAKDYLHRAGRTARAGEAGTVVTLVLPKQRKATLRLLEQAGVEAELTKVAPSSDVLRELTGGRPVAEYAAEAEAWRTARNAARQARFEDRGERGDRFERGGDRFDRGGDRGGRFGRDSHDRFDRNRGTRFERDRAREQRFGDARGGFDRGERPGFGGGSGERSGFGGDRPRSFDRGDRPAFGGDRGERSGFGGDRGGRSFDRGERPGSGSGGDRGGRGERSFDRGPRPAFGGDRNDRGERSGFGGDRGGRTFDRGSRPAFGGDRNERSGSGFGGDRNDRSGSGFGGDRAGRGDRTFDRGERSGSGFGGDRGGRTFDRGTRPAFGGDRNERSGSGFGGDRNERSGSGFGGNRGERSGSGFGGDRAGRGDRTFDRGSRPAFGGDRNDRGERSFDRGSRPAFGGDRNDRGERSGSGFGGDRVPRQDRGFGDRAPRGNDRSGFGGDRAPRTDRPERSDRGPRAGYGDRDTRGGFGTRDSRGTDQRGGFGNRTDRRPADGADRGPWREQRDRRDFGSDRPAANRAGGDRREQRGTGDRGGSTFSRNGGERRGFGGTGSSGSDRRDERPSRDRRW